MRNSSTAPQPTENSFKMNKTRAKVLDLNHEEPFACFSRKSAFSVLRTLVLYTAMKDNSGFIARLMLSEETGVWEKLVIGEKLTKSLHLENWYVHSVRKNALVPLERYEYEIITSTVGLNSKAEKLLNKRVNIEGKDGIMQIILPVNPGY